MNRSIRLVCALAALLATWGMARSAAAQVPTTVAFSGSLSTVDGPVDGSVAITFRLFDQLQNGTEAWSETHNIEADEGLVLAELGGAGSPLDLTVLDGTELWLEVQVGSEVLTPRSPVASVPYATLASHAADSDALGGIAASGWQERITGTCAAGSTISSIASDGSVTCEADDEGVTAVTGGSGINASGTATVNLSVDTSVVQARVTGSCASSQKMIGIGQTGTPTCSTDIVGTGDVTDVTAGNGLSGGGGVGNVTLHLGTPTEFLRNTVGNTVANNVRFCALTGQGPDASCLAQPNGLNWNLIFSFGSGYCQWYCIPN